jgi:hypothetical protein
MIVNPTIPRNIIGGENSQITAWPVDRSARQGTRPHALADAESDGEIKNGARNSVFLLITSRNYSHVAAPSCPLVAPHVSNSTYHFDRSLSWPHT